METGSFFFVLFFDEEDEEEDGGEVEEVVELCCNISGEEGEEGLAFLSRKDSSVSFCPPRKSLS